MKVNLNGNKYDVRFATVYREDKFGRTEDPLKDTVCRISEVDDTKEGKNKYTEVAKGIAWLSHLDKYNKWAGRKLALARALTELNKQDRAVVWAKYKEEYGENRFEVSLPH